MSAANGNASVLPVRDELNLSMDDSGVHGLENNGDASNNCRASSHTTGPAGNHRGFAAASKHPLDASPSVFNGCTVRGTCTFGGGGSNSPVCQTVTGLSDRELPASACKDGFYVLKVPGLVVSALTDPRMALCPDAVVYVCFITTKGQRDVSPEEASFCHYVTETLPAHLESLRRLSGIWTPGTPVPDALIAVLNIDGAGPQLKVVCRNDVQQLFDRLRLRVGKVSAASTINCPPSPPQRKMHGASSFLRVTRVQATRENDLCGHNKN